MDQDGVGSQVRSEGGDVEQIQLVEGEPGQPPISARFRSFIARG